MNNNIRSIIKYSILSRLFTLFWGYLSSVIIGPYDSSSYISNNFKGRSTLDAFIITHLKGKYLYILMYIY